MYKYGISDATLHHESGDAHLFSGLLHGGGPLAQPGALVLLLAPLELLLAAGREKRYI